MYSVYVTICIVDMSLYVWWICQYMHSGHVTICIVDMTIYV